MTLGGPTLIPPPRIGRPVAAPKPTKKGLTYAGSGVDVVEEEKHIKTLIGALAGVKRTGFAKPIDMPGGYAGLIEFGDHALVLCTDGVGSKVEIARALGKYDTVGIDCMAMNVNDALCVGAEPIGFVDYLAVEKHDTGFMAQIGAGLAEGARQGNVTIVGGETATLPGIVNGFDLAGTCLGSVRKEDILDGSRVRAGDVLIGIPSFGIHSNGYTLVRKIVERAGLHYTDPFPGHGLQKHRLGDVLLEPTRIYVKPIMALLGSGIEVHALAHITGGGLMNLPRMNKGFRYTVEKPLTPQPVFDWLRAAGDVELDEMYRTFNMGMGFVVCVAEDDAKQTLAKLAPHLKDKPALCGGNLGEPARVVGHVEKGTGCLLAPHGFTYASKT